MPVSVCSSVAAAREILRDGVSAVVVVPMFNAYEDVVQCLQALSRHAPPETDLLLVDDGSTDPRIAALATQLSDVRLRIAFLRHGDNRGFVRTMNEAFDAAGRRDVVLLNSDVIIGPECLERLGEVARSDHRIATVTPLTNRGTIVSVPHRNVPSDLPQNFTPESAARAIASASARLRPALPTCIGHMTYIKRMALDLVGGFDEVFSPGYGEEVDFSQRCTLIGLSHVCADDVFVYHRGGASFGCSPEVERQRQEHEAIIARRYAFYHPWISRVAASRGTPLALALAKARRVLLGFTVAVDATCLGPVVMGTQRLIVETVLALARDPRVDKVIAVVPDAYSQTDPFASLLRASAKVVTMRVGAVSTSIADVAYRPFQVHSPSDVDRLRRWGEKVVLAQLDLIAFNNPGYWPHWRDWMFYRDATRLGLAVADGVAFLSHHTREECRTSGLLAPGQPVAVVYGGTDHATGVPAAATVPSELAEAVGRGGFILCLGTDYQHKNRTFALRVFASMTERGYAGVLVVAGARVPNGSSRADEAAYLLERGRLSERVVSLAHVSEATRTWLLQHAELVLNPTLYEGFGLIPFEAAMLGAPCLTSAQTALGELLPPDVEVIADWDAARTAEQAMAILADPARSRRLIDSLAARAREFTWDGAASRLVDLFHTVCGTVRGPEIIAVTGEAGEIGGARVSGDSGAMVGADHDGNGRGTLHGPLEEFYPRQFQEAMRAIGRRRGLRVPLVAVTVFGYRVASALRKRLWKHAGEGVAGE